MMTIDSSPPSLSPQAPAEGGLHLLGGADAGDLDILLPGGVYALVPQSPPARFPLCSGFLKAAVTSGRVCHVLLRTNPSDFLDRLEQSSWPQAREAWQGESLRVYPMADGFSKLLFRRDVESLTKELTHWGVASGDILLVDAGDELLSLHDLFMATGQLIKIRNWAKEQKVTMLLNFALAGAGSSIASLTGLMDHFSGMARLRSDSEGPVVTLDYWQSEWGTVAERTVLLVSEAGAWGLRPVSHSLNNSNSVTTTVIASETSPQVDRRKATAEGSAPVSVTSGFFTDDPMWGRELRMLTGTAWQSFSDVADIQFAAKEVTVSQIVLSFSQYTLLSDLARNIYFLRAELHPQTRIVVAEHRMSLRYANELMLMKMGADAIIRKDISLERWPAFLKNLQSQVPRLFEKVDVDVALASASSSKEKGVLELPHFVAEVQATVEKAQVLGVPFAMAVLRSRDVDIRSALLKAINIRRTGDLLTTDRTDVFVFFYACSLTMAPKVLASVFDGKMAKYVNEIDWMTSERDIHNLIADLHEKQTTYKAGAQAHASAEFGGVVIPADASMVAPSVDPSAAAHSAGPAIGGAPKIPDAVGNLRPAPDKLKNNQFHDAASQISSPASDDYPPVPTGGESAPSTHPSASGPVQSTPVPAHVPEDVGPGPTVHAALPSEPPTPKVSDRPQWRRPNLPKRPSEPLTPEVFARVVQASDLKAVYTLSTKQLAVRVNEVTQRDPPRHLPGHLLADRRNGAANAAEDNNPSSERRVTELIRRLALPAKIREQTEKNPDDRRIAELIRRLASPAKVREQTKNNAGANDPH